MKELIIAANWKSNIAKFEAKKWLEDFSMLSISDGKSLILFAPFTLLDIISGYIRVNDMPIALGAQDVSPFDSGAFTGEVSADQIKEFADYALIGHSERRSNFNESIEMVNSKIKKSLAAGLKVIVCVSDLEQVKSLPDSDYIIAYEPIEAIGTGNAEDPIKTSDIVSQIKQIKDRKVIYGGSVDSQNVTDYTDLENISGVLVGSASLEAKKFGDLINAA